MAHPSCSVRRLGALAALLSLVLVEPAGAVGKVYLGGDWDVDSSWQPKGKPGSGDDVSINGAAQISGSTASSNNADLGWA